MWCPNLCCGPGRLGERIWRVDVSVLCQPCWDPLEPSLGVCCSSPEICLAGEVSPPWVGLSFNQFLSSYFSYSGLTSCVTLTTPGFPKAHERQLQDDLVKRVLIGLFAGSIPFFLLVAHILHRHTLKLPLTDRYSSNG